VKVSLRSLVQHLPPERREWFKGWVEVSTLTVTKAHIFALKLVLAAVLGVLEGPEGDWRPGAPGERQRGRCIMRLVQPRVAVAAH
jgi:hypothetical protein